MELTDLVIYGLVGVIFLATYGLTLRFLSAIFGEEKQ